eukprot:m51a1_g6872 putative ras-related protein rab-25 (477) ;mRNA; f:173586-175402
MEVVVHTSDYAHVVRAPVAPASTGADLKRAVADRTGFAPADQLLMLRGRTLDDTSPLSLQGVDPGTSVLLFVVARRPPGPRERCEALQRQGRDHLARRDYSSALACFAEAERAGGAESAGDAELLVESCWAALLADERTFRDVAPSRASCAIRAVEGPQGALMPRRALLRLSLVLAALAFYFRGNSIQPESVDRRASHWPPPQDAERCARHIEEADRLLGEEERTPPLATPRASRAPGTPSPSPPVDSPAVRHRRASVDPVVEPPDEMIAEFVALGHTPEEVRRAISESGGDVAAARSILISTVSKREVESGQEGRHRRMPSGPKTWLHLLKPVRRESVIDSEPGSGGPGTEAASQPLEDERRVLGYFKSRADELRPAEAVIRRSHGALLVDSVASRQSFGHAEQWLREIREDAPEAVVMLVGNKSDLGSQREVSTDEGMGFAQNNGLLFTEMSTNQSTWTNVRPSIENLIRGMGS